MKTLKIITGFLLLFGVGKEYVNASRDLGSFFLPSIIIPVLLFLILCTWLIGSGFSVRKFKFKSFAFLKFFIISFVTFLFAGIWSLGAKVVPSNFVEINELKVPLGKCIHGTRRLLPDENKRADYCKCLVEKITTIPELKEKYKELLEGNKVLDVLADVQNDPKYLDLRIESCFQVAQMEWTDELAAGMKRNWEKEFSGTEFEQTNDIDKYCNCLIEKYRLYPLNEILSDEFVKSEKALKIEEECTTASGK